MFYRRGVAALLSLGMVLSMGMTAFASTNKEYTEIKSVKFSLKFDGFDEYGFPQFTGNSSSSNYVLNDVYRYTTSQDPDWGDAYEAKEDTHDNWWEEDYDPFLYEEEQEKLVTESEDYLDTIEIPLNYYFYDREKHPITSEVYVAEFRCDENNYKFNVKTDKVTLKNADAKIHSCALEENSSILKVKFTLNNENAYVGNVEEESVSLDDNYTLTWKPAALAQRYKLRIYGSSYSQLEILTDTLSYSLRGLATKAGNYKIKLYALDAAGNATKEYAEVTMSVSDESAALVNTEFAAVPYGWYSEVKNVAVTDENGIVNQIPTTIWHYRLPSGIIAQGEWVSSTVVNADNSTSTVWYYIKPNTEMAVNEWIMSNGKSYYMTETGAMLVNAKAPDGSTVNDKGEKTK